jgi:filamentous hemagglutinin family protein
MIKLWREGTLPCGKLTVTTMGRVAKIMSIIATSIAVAVPSALYAQRPTVIRTDSSWGRTPTTIAPSQSNKTIHGNAGTDYNITGNIYTIPETRGRIAGTNLFHSFEGFSVGAGDAAVFTTQTLSLQNVITRVSGQSPSSIEGLIALLPAPGSHPNFFFINPAGVTFRGDALLIDVPGAFHVSTANYLRFAGKTLFAAGAGHDSTLSVMPPEAFGFLGTTRSAINLSDGAVLISFPGGALSAIAGDVRITQALLLGQGPGNVRVAAVGADVVEIPLTGALPAVHGTLDISNQGGVATFSFGSQDSGMIAVSAGDIVVDSRSGGSNFARIETAAVQGTSGNAGNIVVNATGTLTLLDGGVVGSATETTGKAGSISVTAAALASDARDSPYFTGIISTGLQGASGDAGNVDVRITGPLQLVNGGAIKVEMLGSGNGGSLKVEAGSLSIDSLGKDTSTGIASQTYAQGGNVGPVEIAVSGNLSILDGADISSWTRGAGNAGSVFVRAANIDIDGKSSPRFTGISSQAIEGSGQAASVDVITGRLSVASSGSISSQTFSAGAGGFIDIHAQSMMIDGRGSSSNTGVISQAEPSSSNKAGSIKMAITGELSIVDGGSISSATTSSGAAGSIRIDAGSMSIDGRTNTGFTGITSQAAEGTGRSGDVDLTVSGALTVMRNGKISSETFTTGPAGLIRIAAGSMRIDGREGVNSTGVITQANPESSSTSGRIEVSVAGALSLADGAVISSSTFAGDAGAVVVSAGTIDIERPHSNLFTGIFAFAEAGSTGHAGDLMVSTQGLLSLGPGGWIAANTAAAGNAAAVKVSAGDILIDAHGNDLLSGIFANTLLGASGNAGRVDVTATGRIAVRNGGVITSATRSSGDAGQVSVSANSIVLDGGGGRLFTGVTSESEQVGAGRAGSVQITAAKDLSVLNGAAISSNTFSRTSSSEAVRVDAETILVDGSGSEISARARSGSAGQPGNVTVRAGSRITLASGGRLSISNDAAVADPGGVTPTTLTVAAPTITLEDAQISAASTGNVAASNVRVLFTDRLMLDPSSITTSANHGNGGAVRVEGSGVLFLDNSQITTSVSGNSGNGGDITVHAAALVMQTGFIQANTAGTGAAGGNIAIDVQTLVPSGGTIDIGGATPLPFQLGRNVIQAAAPTGISGIVEVTAPVLDIAGSLHPLSGDIADTAALPKDLCRIGAGSSLTPLGRGGLHSVASGMIRPEGRILLTDANRSAEATSSGQLARAAIHGRCE